MCFLRTAFNEIDGRRVAYMSRHRQPQLARSAEEMTGAELAFVAN
jgi:hypothetical protein